MNLTDADFEQRIYQTVAEKVAAVRNAVHAEGGPASVSSIIVGCTYQTTDGGAAGIWWMIGTNPFEMRGLADHIRDNLREPAFDLEGDDDADG